MAKFVGLAVGVLIMAAVVTSVLGVLVMAAAVYGVYRGYRALDAGCGARAAAAVHQRAELLARAELQHRWHLAGDPRGTYGRYTPAA